MTLESTGRVMKFFGNPIVGFVGAFASVIGFGLAVYLFFSGTIEPRLTYLRHPIKTTVVRAENTSGLEVLYRGEKVGPNITAVQFAIWNAGKQAITETAILDRIEVFTVGHSPILEASIRKSSREVCSIALNTDSSAQGVLGLTWRILEHQDGCVVQIIYAGGLDESVCIRGVVEGQREIAVISNDESVLDQDEQYRQTERNRLLTRALLWAMVVLGVSTGIATYYLGRRSYSRGSHKMFWAMGVIMVLVNTVAAVYILVTTKPVGPPFGF